MQTVAAFTIEHFYTQNPQGKNVLDTFLENSKALSRAEAEEAVATNNEVPDGPAGEVFKPDKIKSPSTFTPGTELSRIMDLLKMGKQFDRKDLKKLLKKITKAETKRLKKSAKAAKKVSVSTFGGTTAEAAEEAIALLVFPQVNYVDAEKSLDISPSLGGIRVMQLVVTRVGVRFYNPRLIGAFDSLTDPAGNGAASPNIEAVFEIVADNTPGLKSNNQPAEYVNNISAPTPSATVDFAGINGIEFWTGGTKAFVFTRSEMLNLRAHLAALKAKHSGLETTILFSGYKRSTGRMAEDMNMVELEYWKQKYSNHPGHDFTQWQSLKVEIVTDTKDAAPSVGKASLKEYMEGDFVRLPVTFYAHPCPPNYGVLGALLGFSNRRVIEGSLKSEDVDHNDVVARETIDLIINY